MSGLVRSISLGDYAMDNENKIQLFEDKRIRTAWDEEAEDGISPSWM